METTIKRRTIGKEEHKRVAGVLQKAVLPTICFAALSSMAFEKAVHAAQPNIATVNNMVSTSTTKYVKISSGVLNLRAAASTGAAVISTLANGTGVEVYSEANGWAKVHANGKDGYVSTLYLSAPGTLAGQGTSSQVTAVTKYVKISSGVLNLRAAASTGAAVISTLANGTGVEVYSEANGWAKVHANGKDGYVSSSFLSSPLSSSKTGPGSTAGVSGTIPVPAGTSVSAPKTKYVNVASGSLNLRNGASTGASIIVQLAKGTPVKVDTESAGWSKVEVYGHTGYVSSQYLADSLPNSSPSQVTVPQPVVKYVNVNKDSSLNLRGSASNSSAVLAQLPNGTEVTVYSDINGWAKVEAGGRQGYVSSSFLSVSKPTTAEQPPAAAVTKYVNVDTGSSLNMRKSPSANSSIIVQLARGVEVTVLSVSNGWAEIKAYGQTGFVNSEYLADANQNANQNANPVSTVAAGNPATDSSANGSTFSGSNEKYVNVIYGSSLNMRSDANTNAAIVNKLARGTVVTVISEANGWSKVTANGITGYVSSQYLSMAQPFNPSTGSNPSNIVYETYNLSLNQMENIQMAASPQTDKKYTAYIRADALTLTGPASGTVNSSGWNIRGGAGTQYRVVGQVQNSQALQILAKVKGADGFDWYQVNYEQMWVNASPEDVAYYLNPDNFINSPVDSLQFLNLSASANLDAAEVDTRILAGKGSLQNMASTFITAGSKYGINEIYLISHALLETGNGTSQLANGVSVNGKTVYNMYGIGAYDADPVTGGSQFAYNAGWFTPEEAILGGAQFIANGYINAGQDTLYKMRWNPASAADNGFPSHQYATDIGWAAKQTDQIYNLYRLLDSYQIKLEIPKYQ